MRWRKARFPEAGTRWATPMNRFVWERDHGDDIELWQGDFHLATVKPCGKWALEIGAYPRRSGNADDVAGAKRDAKEAAKKVAAKPFLSERQVSLLQEVAEAPQGCKAIPNNREWRAWVANNLSTRTAPLLTLRATGSKLFLTITEAGRAALS